MKPISDYQKLYNVLFLAVLHIVVKFAIVLNDETMTNA